jgi:hypothetical protein
MDYSLLIGVVQRKFEVMERKTESSEGLSPDNLFHQDADGGMHAAVVEGPGTYYMGIIDVLQQWDYSKRLERFFKIVFRWQDGDGLSAINPKDYVKRFMQRSVIDVFDGLDVDDEHYIAKRRMHITQVTDQRSESIDSRERTRTVSMIRADTRFSAAPMSSYKLSGSEIDSKSIDRYGNNDATRLRSTSENSNSELYSGV